MSKLYAVTGVSESGDDYFLGIFNEKPTDEHLLAIIERDYPDEVIDDGDGLVSYISCRVHETDGISELPEPTTSDIEFI